MFCCHYHQAFIYKKQQLNGTLCYDEFFPNIEFVKEKSLKTIDTITILKLSITFNQNNT